MGKKVKKGRGPPKAKRAASHSANVVAQQCSPGVEAVDVVSVVKEKRLCPHLDKGFDLKKLSEKVGSGEPIRCEDCRQGAADRRGGNKIKHGKKKGSASVDSKSESKALWVCLECGHYSCGGVGLPTLPQSHAVRHARLTHHPIAIKLENTHLRWCFPCSTLLPVEKMEGNGQQQDLLSDAVKLIKRCPSERSAVDAEEVCFGGGTGSITSGIKLSGTLSEGLLGKGGYVVRGLVNLGNTCFFNSIMQNLLALHTLRDYFLELDPNFGSFTIALKKIFVETKPEAGLKNVINPRSFFGCVCTKAPQFRGYQQHDAHELLRCLLDSLSTEELGAKKKIRYSQDKQTSSNQGHSFVDDVFGGQISSTVCCLECGHSSTVYEAFLDLSLPVPTKKPQSKRAQSVFRGKKPKLPPKRSGRTRQKVGKDAHSFPTQCVSSTSAISESSSMAEPSSLAAVRDCTQLCAYGPTHTADLISSVSQNFPAVQESENEQVLENTAELTSAMSDSFAWMDYLEPEPVLNEQDPTSEDNNSLVLQDFGAAIDTKSRVLIENSSQSDDNQVCPLDNTAELTSAMSDSFAWMDYLEPEPVLNEQDPTSEDNNSLVFQDCGVANNTKSRVLIENSSQSDDNQVCPLDKDPNPEPDSSLVNSLEEELPLLVKDSEVLLLPYNEVSPSTVIVSEEAEASSAAGCEQEELDFDGVGNLFNEPDVVVGPMPRPSLGDDFLQSNDAETSFMALNASESEPDEVDNSNSPVSVESCLAHFIKPECLSNENAWHCENCSKSLWRQRLEAQKGPSLIVTNGVGIRSESNPRIPNLGNGDIKSSDAFNSTGESSLSHNEKDDSMNQNCTKGKLDELNSLLSPEEENGGMTDAHKEPSYSSNSNEACCRAIADPQVSDSLDGPCISSTNTEKANHHDSELMARESEADEVEGDEIDSKIAKVMRDATKRVLIDKVPPILTIHLKRFCQDDRGRLSKLNGYIKFGETLDLRQYMDPRHRCTDKEKYSYSLVGVVEHSGSMRGGHYVAYVRGGEKSKGKEACVWYHASDAYVRQASLEEVLRSEAYILFYERN